jgi:glycosyltransferase involved in cell wall biosynthesis
MADVPLVSVIVPTYNRAELLQRSLRSVGQQDYPSLEVVVVDDVSTDDTLATVEQLSTLLGERGIPVRLVQLTVNSGPSVARNRGVEAAEGTLLSFLDSDDLMEASFVSTVAALLAKYPQCALGFCEAWKIDPDDRKIGRLESGLALDPGEGVLDAPLDQLAQHELFQTASVLMRRNAFEGAGGFDETLRYSEDTDLWWRLAKGGDFAYTVEPLVCHRYHPGNVSKNEEALVDAIRVFLRHLEDVRDPAARSAHVARIQRRQVLLQEMLLRDPRPADSYRELLEASIGPASVRYRIGRRLARSPVWLRRLYVFGIRTARGARRVLARSGAGDFSDQS